MPDSDAEPGAGLDPRPLCGWLPDEPSRPAIAASLPTLAQAGPNLAADPSKNVLLYKCWSEVFTGAPAYPAQQIGDCVSFGHAHAHDLLMTIECYLGDRPIETIRRTCTEAVYAMSREIGGFLGRSDGSYGAVAVKAMREWGLACYADLGDVGLETTYSGSRAKDWGYRGAPARVKELAAGQKLGAAALVSTWDELTAAIGNGYPVTICSNQGFTMTRDADGFCAARGSWAHCMFIAGIRVDKPGALICQSWGPDTPSGPRALGQPGFSFWADRRTIERILSAGDSWALSGSPGFRPRPLPANLHRD